MVLFIKVDMAFKIKRTTRLSIAIAISFSFFLVEIIGMYLRNLPVMCQY